MNLDRSWAHAEMARALSLFLEKGQVTELRVLEARTNSYRAPHVISGYFDNHATLIDAAKEIDDAKGIYFIPNPVNPVLLARAQNRCRDVGKEPTTGDGDIVSRRWLLIDLDPVRPSGISSSDAEHDAAIERARTIRDVLSGEGWPAAVVADSGNGAHLLYRIDLPSDDDGLVKRVLSALAFRFDDDVVRVDQTTHNPARIWKLYGTLARKGDNVPDRPHRYARLLEVPDVCIPAPAELLESIAGTIPVEPPNTKQMASTIGAGSAFDLDRWIDESGLDTIGPTPWQGGRKWVLPVCHWNDNHRNRSAYIVQFAGGAIAAGCHHDSCRGLGWRDLRQMTDGTVKAPTGCEDSEDIVHPIPMLGSVKAVSEDGAWEPPTPFHEYPVPSFPTHALPNWLRYFVEAEAVATQTPPDLAAMLSLAVCATACAKMVDVHATPDWVEPVNIFTVVALPPGNRKSAVFRDLTDPISEFEASELQASKISIAEKQNELTILEAKLREAQRKAGSIDSKTSEADRARADELARQIAEFTVPTTPRLLVDDTSPERLATLLHEQGGRIAVMAAEGDIFDIMTGRYSSSSLPNLGVFLKGHAGDSQRVDRVNRPAEHVESSAITMGLAVQPGVLHGLLKNPWLHNRGLLARFLYSLPPSPVGRREIEVPPVPSRLRDRYRRAVHRLLSLEPNVDADGKPRPHALTLTDDAFQLLRQLQTWLEPQLAPGRDLEHVVDWASKLAGAILRIAGLLHMIEHVDQPTPWRLSIELETLENATIIGIQYLLPHAIAAYGHMGSDPTVDQARFLLDKIDQIGTATFTKRELFQKCKSRFKKVADMNPALTLLEQHGFVRMDVTDRQSSAGRPPSPVYEVNPVIIAQNAQNAQKFSASESSLEQLTAERIELERETSEDWEFFEHDPGKISWYAKYIEPNRQHKAAPYLTL